MYIEWSSIRGAELTVELGICLGGVVQQWTPSVGPIALMACSWADLNPGDCPPRVGGQLKGGQAVGAARQDDHG